MQKLRASGSGTDLSSASPCNDKKWAADTMYRPPLIFSVVKNGFQGVPERYNWVPYAMLANRRSRAGYAGALAAWLPATFFLSFQKMVVK